MGEKNKFRMRKFLVGIAALSLLISIVEGVIYYSTYENPFFKVLMILQNSINAFAFKPGIAIKDVREALEKTDSVWVHAVGYAYCISIFAAYYCTLAAVYKLLEQALRFVFIFKRNKGKEHILVFGYNEDVKILLENGIADIGTDGKKYVVHVINPEEIGAEERYKYLKKGYLFHQFDCFKAGAGDLKYLFKHAYVDKATQIILLDHSSTRNFSLLQMLYGFYAPNEAECRKQKLADNVKVFCRCDDDGVRRMIADFYDRHTESGKIFDLELVNLAEMQVRKMYDTYSIHNYYTQKNVDIKNWSTNLLIIGFGEVGQQTLLQSFSLGIVSSENPITVNVLDFHIQEKAEIFANHFSLDSFEMDKDHFHLKDDVADGSMDIYFHNMDVRYKQFRRFLENQQNLPTYVVIAIDDLDVVTHCVLELKQFLADRGEENVPIVLRMDSDRRLADYISDNKDRVIFENVAILEDRKRFLSFAYILNENIDSMAKAFNLKYSLFRFTEDGDAMPDRTITEQEAWQHLKLFKRDSSRELAYHEKVKRLIYDHYEKNAEIKLRDKLEELFGYDGVLLLHRNDAWSYNGSEEDFMQNLMADDLAYEIAKMEHRRWCYFMVSRGWRPDKTGRGQKSEEWLINPCLVTEEELIESKPYMVKYDLMPLLAEYVKEKERTRDE